jgi:hypothetical protein
LPDRTAHFFERVLLVGAASALRFIRIAHSRGNAPNGELIRRPRISSAFAFDDARHSIGPHRSAAEITALR